MTAKHFFAQAYASNCNYILFTKLPWPGDREGTFRSLSQAATCPKEWRAQEKEWLFIEKSRAVIGWKKTIERASLAYNF